MSSIQASQLICAFSKDIASIFIPLLGKLKFWYLASSRVCQVLVS